MLSSSSNSSSSVDGGGGGWSCDFCHDSLWFVVLLFLLTLFASYPSLLCLLRLTRGRGSGSVCPGRLYCAMEAVCVSTAWMVSAAITVYVINHNKEDGHQREKAGLPTRPLKQQ